MGAGGAARTLLNVINNIDRTKFEPVLVTLNYDGSYEQYIEPDVKFVKLNTQRLRSAIIPLSKVIRQESVDIVFSTIPNYNIIAILARLLSFTKAKNIVREAAFLGGTRSMNCKLLIYGLFYRFASKVISLSNGVKENLVERYKVNRDNIQVIYNPVDLRNIQQSIEQGTISEEHASIFSGNDKVIVTAGRLVKDKDQRTLLQAFAKVNARINSKLVILGEGELEEELKALALHLHIHEDVHFIGFQENPYVYFQQADLFVLSSIREGFGHVLAEALAAGTPVISTHCKPGAEEVLCGGEYGKLCEVGNSEQMAEFMYADLSMTKKEEIERINKGYKRASQFDAVTIVKQYEDVFRQTVGQLNEGVEGS
ncbi:glycosyltransferase [Pontibacillus litoralis]|nr:glycosyltransferase [Pontibacillus litoralis]